MSIEFTCPECAEKNSVGPEFGGRHGKCAFCGAGVIVPQASGPAQLVTSSGGPPSQKAGASWLVVLAIAGGVLGVMVVCGGLLLALLLPAISAAREAGRRASCTNNVRQIDLALQNYVATYGHFPPAATPGKNGKPPMSWRVAILPFMGQDALYHQYDQSQAWDSPKNLALSKMAIHEFRCPSDGEVADGETSYFMITGKNTVGGTPGSPGTPLSAVTSGTSTTVMLVEVQGLKIPWSAPRDITIDELIAKLGSGRLSGHPAVFVVGMADGSVQTLPSSIDAETLRRLALMNGEKPRVGQY
jgi:hypothetical protein